MQESLCKTRYFIAQKLSNKQIADVICGFDRLRTCTQQETNKPYEQWKTYRLPTHLIT